MQNKTQQKIKLTYFDWKARAEITRLIFTIGGIEFEDERLTREEFEKAKSEGKVKYDFLPNLEVDGKIYAQSLAIAKFASLKAGLTPSDPLTILKIEQVLENLNEILDRVIPTFRIADVAEKKKAREQLTTTTIPKWLQNVEDLLTENGGNGFIAGDKLTYGEVSLFTTIGFLKSGLLDHVPTTIVDKYPNILKVFGTVLSNPRVQEWYAKHPPKK